MTRTAIRSRLFAPLVHLAALVLLLEEWCWDAGMRLARRMAGWAWIGLVEARVRTLPPYGALCVFVLPGLLLAPVKVLALVAIAHGHVVAGVAAIAAAKLGGAAVVARLYVLTLPSLLAVGWFARSHGWFMALKARWIGRLRASASFCRARRALAGLKLGCKRLRRRLARRLRRAGRRQHRSATHRSTEKKTNPATKPTTDDARP